MRPGKERGRATRPKVVVVVVMVGGETGRPHRTEREGGGRVRLDRPGLTGSGHWAMAGGRAPSRLDGTMGKPGHGQGMARHGQAGQGMAGNRAGTGLWALLGGGWTGDWGLGTQTGTGNSKTVHRPHANQNRLDPPDGDDPREQQGEPLLGVCHQLSGPERLKSGIRPMLASLLLASCQHVRTVWPGPYGEIWPSQPLRRVATRARPQFETARETRYPSWPWHPPSFLPLPPSLSIPFPGPCLNQRPRLPIAN